MTNLWTKTSENFHKLTLVLPDQFKKWNVVNTLGSCPFSFTFQRWTIILTSNSISCYVFENLSKWNHNGCPHLLLTSFIQLFVCEISYCWSPFFPHILLLYAISLLIIFLSWKCKISQYFSLLSVFDIMWDFFSIFMFAQFWHWLIIVSLSWLWLFYYE